MKKFCTRVIPTLRHIITKKNFYVNKNFLCQLYAKTGV